MFGDFVKMTLTWVSSHWLWLESSHRFESRFQLCLLHGKQNYYINQGFFEENVKYPVWTYRDPISLILGTRFFLVRGTHW